MKVLFGSMFRPVVEGSRHIECAGACEAFSVPRGVAADFGGAGVPTRRGPGFQWARRDVRCEVEN